MIEYSCGLRAYNKLYLVGELTISRTKKYYGERQLLLRIHRIDRRVWEESLLDQEIEDKI